MRTFEFELLDALRDERLTAGEIACDVSLGKPDYARRSAIGISNQLRRLYRKGFVQHDGGPGRIYSLTEKGRAYVDA